MRIKVVVQSYEDENNEVDWESMGIDRPPQKYIWKRRVIESEDIEFFDETSDDQTMLYMYNEMRMLIDEDFDSFSERLDLIEGNYKIEEKEDETIQKPQPVIQKKH